MNDTIDFAIAELGEAGKALDAVLKKLTSGPVSKDELKQIDTGD